MDTQSKLLILGTAQWGWTVSRTEAFKLLDAWLKAGFRQVDCATNYPINRNPDDFRAAEKILLEYVNTHGLRDLQITMKLGSLDNLRSPEVNLAPSFVQMMAAEYFRLFGSNLGCAMFHWDNCANVEEIHSSLEAMKYVQQEYGIRPGLSGIAHPSAYADANADLGLSFDVQLKHNVLQSDFERYSPITNHQLLITNHHLYAYGINAGGIKLDTPYPTDSTFLARGGQPEKAAPILEKISAFLPVWNTAFVRPPIKTMNHIGLIFAGLHPGLSGILLGVSSLTQLQETLDFWRNFEVFDYADVFSALKKIHLQP